MTNFDSSSVEWSVSPGLVDYPGAVAAMEKRAAAIRHSGAPELVWLLEHPPLYTAGTSARPEDLTDPDRLPVYHAGRGGQYTFHGPGQRIAYVMLDVQRRFGSDVRTFVATLEGWIIDTLATFGLAGEVRPGRVGVWVHPAPAEPERKIAAIGIRIRHGVSFHGVSLNVDPDLSQYDGIVPCGIADRGVTSFTALGHASPMKNVDMCLQQTFERAFETKTRLVAPALAGLQPARATADSTR